MDTIKTTNKLLLVLVIPAIFYILDLLSFIFIPFMFAIFIALLFTPLMRWLKKRHAPKALALIIVILVLFSSFFMAFKLVQLSARQISVGEKELYEKLDTKIAAALEPFAEFFGIEPSENEGAIKKILQSRQIREAIYQNFRFTFSFVQDTVVMTLMTLFFLLLLLGGSLNLKVVLQEVLSKGKTQSVKTFVSIERSITLFLKVKFFTSLLTGIGFGLICYFFGVSFPLFWGLMAFVLNFVQMVGSIVITVATALFAFIEIVSPGSWFLSILLFTGVQVVVGSVLEPILLGRSFRINIIVVLIMLMFWGFLWGVPGLILSIPITVLVKTIMEEFESTRHMARMMS